MFLPQFSTLPLPNRKNEKERRKKQQEKYGKNFINLNIFIVEWFLVVVDVIVVHTFLLREENCTRMKKRKKNVVLWFFIFLFLLLFLIHVGIIIILISPKGQWLFMYEVEWILDEWITNINSIKNMLGFVSSIYCI